jgi:FixJ family two-component response regulator
LKSGQVSNTVCLITDLHMPGLNGLDLQEHLLEGGYCTPIIFVTAFPDGKSRDRALKAGAIAYLSKPFEENSLINAIGLALGDHSQEGEVSEMVAKNPVDLENRSIPQKRGR